MNYKLLLYKNYGGTHNSRNSPQQSLKKIEERFPVYDFFFYSNFLPDLTKSSILEIGCGDGDFVYYLQKSGCKHATGIDLSEEQTEIGSKLGISGLKLAELNTYLSDFDSSFDCIIARDVVEHLTRQEAIDALFKIFKALKPGGSFIMQVPNGEGINYTSIFFGDYTHEMAYSWRSVNQVFLNIGFEDIRSFPVNPYSGNIKGKIRAGLRYFKILHKRFWKMIEFGSSKGIFTENLIAIGKKPSLQ